MEPDGITKAHCYSVLSVSGAIGQQHVQLVMGEEGGKPGHIY